MHKAEREFLRALELNPRYIQALIWYSFGYQQMVAGRLEQGVSIAKKAVEYVEVPKPLPLSTGLTAGPLPGLVSWVKLTWLMKSD